jgi:hypothetical protein
MGYDGEGERERERYETKRYVEPSHRRALRRSVPFHAQLAIISVQRGTKCRGFVEALRSL